MGNAAFASHQWAAKHHPDPDFEQMRVLQDALRRLLSSEGYVPPEPVTEVSSPTARGVWYQAFQSQPLFIWYDYFSVPQLEKRATHATDDTDGSNQAKAIHSIPAYVANCKFFFALCPTIDCIDQSRVVLNAATWASRGWCRVERAARELSAQDKWILVRSSSSLAVVGTAFSFVSGSVGEGTFTVPEDCWKLAPVMKAIVRSKLLHCLQTGDLRAYRRHLNLQSVYLRGLQIEPVADLIPDGKAPAWSRDLVAGFLYQNYFSGVSSTDSAGWRPLHYAALSGNVKVVEGLLQRRADPNRRTWQPEPKLGFQPWVSALDMAIFYKHNEVAQLLLDSRAQLGGIYPTMQLAAISDNAEGIRLLCDHGGKATERNIFGITVLDAATSYGSMMALEELLERVQPSSQELGRVLLTAMCICGGSAQLVDRLVGLRADINFQCDLRRDWSLLACGIGAAVYPVHKSGLRRTALSTFVYHINGLSPLMAAVHTGQHEGAAALIAAGARLDIRNSQSWTAADFARGMSVPRFLQKGLEGDPWDCFRIASMAHGYVETYM
ncbi:ASB3 [Symbiodinium natans]|uniref:ASB3 protein n=1 Tax=Symbiodinium natans TaxID=878477 RepID=A0A812PVE6_9DINO|nr:ASB3 [Symbiodinium natans]